MPRLFSLVVVSIAAAAASPALHTTFDGSQLPRGWKPVLSMVTGPGPSSTVVVEDGLLHLSAPEDAARFLSAQTRVSVPEGGWVSVGARVRLQPSGAPLATEGAIVYAWCDVVRPVVQGTMDGSWREEERWIFLPKPQSVLSVGAFLRTSGDAWFDDVRVSRSAEFVIEERGSFRYFHAPDDVIDDASHAYSEASIEILESVFGRRRSREAIPFVKYRDVAMLARYTGETSNALSFEGGVHTIWPGDRHELVHVFDEAWGAPPVAIREGFAVTLTGDWNRLPLPDFAAGMVDTDRWIPLAALLGSAAFGGFSPLESYAEVGALVQMVVEERGMEAVHGLYGLAGDASAETTLAAVGAALGVPALEVEEKLRVWLRQHA